MPVSSRLPSKITPESLASMVTKLAVMSGSTLSSVIVFGWVGGKLVGSNRMVVSGCRFVSACRKVPGPLSSVFVTKTVWSVEVEAMIWLRSTHRTNIQITKNTNAKRHTRLCLRNLAEVPKRFTGLTKIFRFTLLVFIFGIH